MFVDFDQCIQNILGAVYIFVFYRYIDKGRLFTDYFHFQFLVIMVRNGFDIPLCNINRLIYGKGLRLQRHRYYTYSSYGSIDGVPILQRPFLFIRTFRDKIGYLDGVFIQRGCHEFHFLFCRIIDKMYPERSGTIKLLFSEFATFFIAHFQM